MLRSGNASQQVRRNLSKEYLKLLYLNSLNYEGETPLHLIAEIYSNGKCLKILFYEKTMLAESLLIVKELISADADINARTLAGKE